jgi:hypothetical protein
MQILRDILHIARNMQKVNKLWGEVRLIVKRDRGVDLERLPSSIKMQQYQRVKQEFINGNTSAEDIASMMLA